MKHKLILLSVLSVLFFTFSSCKEEKIKCKITSPENEAEFWESESIPVTIETSINKGSIIQVQLFVDDEVFESRTEPPFDHFLIPSKTISPGMHYLTAAAYSSNNQEVNSIFIIIK